MGALLFAIVSLLALAALARSFLGSVREGMNEAEVAWRRKHRRCLTCEYSLRGNQSGVCPECGTPFDLERI